MSEFGKGKESDPTDASVNTSANTSVDTPLTHYRHVSRHTTDTSADTLLTRRQTHYRHVGRHTTDAFIEKLAFPNSYFVTSFSRKQEQRHKGGNMKANSRHYENETLVPRSPRCFFQGSVTKGSRPTS